MKKTITLLTAFILILGCLAGCSDDTYKAMLFGGTDASGFSGNIKTYTPKDETYESRNLTGKTKSITWLGKTYTGEYKETRAAFFYENPADRYVADTGENGIVIDFAVDSKTGAILALSKDFKPYNGQYDGMEKTDEAGCRKVADEMLAEITPDHDDYELISTKTSEADYGTAYWFDYHRVVSGISTLDSVLICVSEYGTFESFSTTAFGQMKNIALPASYSEEKIKTALDTAMTSANAGKDDYTVNSKELTKLSDGTLALRVAVDLKKDNGSQLVEFLIKIGK